MHNKGYKKVVTAVALLVLIGSLVTTIPAKSAIQPDPNTQTITIDQTFALPHITTYEQFTNIDIPNLDTCTTDPGKPKLPVYTTTYEFPLGTHITDIEYTSSPAQTLTLSQPVEPVPTPQPVGSQIQLIPHQVDPGIYTQTDSYPKTPHSYHTGVGLNKNNQRVVFLSLHIYPITYHPAQQQLSYTPKSTIHITTQQPDSTPVSSSNPLYDLVIITPSSYTATLQPLMTHKEHHGVTTKLVTLAEIYDNYPGRDNQEQIKYYIKHAVDQWDTHYILLIGDIKEMPIRATAAYPWNGWGNNILTDLYYADIYNTTNAFCSWDENHNNIFGEIHHDGILPPEEANVDNVDLYPDVHIGRLACRTIDEVQTVVDKIITYETTTYDQLWFKKIILAGGDTFPLTYRGAEPFVFEGEITNKKVMEQLPDFTHVTLWSTKRNLNAFTFNRAVTRGAGFLTYAGHGFEHGWGTYRPNALRDKLIIYYTSFLQGIHNGNKLPIVFFDACLTAKLDFNMSDLDHYYPRLGKLFRRLSGVEFDPTNYFPCFAWAWISKQDGGAIATIGATRPAYTWVDRDGVYAGAGYLDVHFFKAHKEGISLGQMFTQTQNEYLNNVGLDFFTIEEFILLGDPSLKVGGYP